MKFRVTPIVAGCFIGLISVLCQLIFGIYPPPAYGICVACHARDLINWLVNSLTGLNLGLAPISKETPVLTTLGIMLGAFTRAIRSKEFKFKMRITKNPFESFLYGFLIAVFALLLGSCPIRTVLRIAYGDAIAIVGWFAITLGVIVCTEIIRWLFRKRLNAEGGT